MEKTNTLVVNIFGGPGTGKSTMMSAIFTELKYLGINCEVAPEYAKEKVWADQLGMLEDQLYIFAKQQHRLWRLNGKVDVIITDSPILFSIIYGSRMKQSFKTLVEEQHLLYNNLNFYLNRVNVYQSEGRLQDEEGAKKIDNRILTLLNEVREPFEVLDADKKSVPIIIEKIISRLK
jgi:nicotinamide riboside kinase